MCCAICLLCGRNFRWWEWVLIGVSPLNTGDQVQSSLIIRLANYSITTSFIYKTDSIGDAWGFSGKTPITLSRGFSVETLTGVTLSWKTELNKSISTIEDRIPRWLQYRYKTWWPLWKAGLYNLELISLQGCNFWVGGIAYNNQQG